MRFFDDPKRLVRDGYERMGHRYETWGSGLSGVKAKYVDVIVRRWQEYAGKDAVHEASGMKFSERERGAKEAAA